MIAQVKPKTIHKLNSLPVNDNLVGAWPVFEGGGSVVNAVAPCVESGVITNATWSKSLYGESLDFNGASGNLVIPSCSMIDNIFTGGGAVSAIVKPASSGEGNNGRILSKNDASGWIMYVGTATGTLNGLLFLHRFSGSYAYWTLTGVFTGYTDTLQVGVTYDNSSTANTPIFYVNGVEYSPSAKVAPSGAAASDAGHDLYIGNRSADDKTFDGLIENIMLFDKIIPSKQMLDISKNPYIGYEEWEDDGWMYEPVAAAGGLLMHPGMDGLSGRYFNSKMNGGLNG